MSPPEPGEFRFTDIIAELRRAAALAWASEDPLGPQLARACRRVERLVISLREQFLRDVALGTDFSVPGLR